MLKQILVVICALIATISCLDGVTELTDANFDELVKQDSSIWLVFFAADWVQSHNNIVRPLPTS